MILPVKVLQVTAPHFCAGVVLSEDRVVVRAAPILAYMLNWNLRKVESYCQKKSWDFGWVPELDERADLESQ